MIVFRHTDRRFVFLWEGPDQPAARWHGDGEGPVQYVVDTPDGAWAEFLRHEEIVTSEDVATIRRALWAVEVPVPPDLIRHPGCPSRSSPEDRIPTRRAVTKRVGCAPGEPSALWRPPRRCSTEERMAGGWTVEFSRAPRVRAA